MMTNVYFNHDGGVDDLISFIFITPNGRCGSDWCEYYWSRLLPRTLT